MNEVTDLQVVLNDVRSILEGSKKAETDSLKSALSKLNKMCSYFHDFEGKACQEFLDFTRPYTSYPRSVVPS